MLPQRDVNEHRGRGKLHHMLSKQCSQERTREGNCINILQLALQSLETGRVSLDIKLKLDPCRESLIYHFAPGVEQLVCSLGWLPLVLGELRGKHFCLTFVLVVDGNFPPILLLLFTRWNLIRICFISSPATFSTFPELYCSGLNGNFQDFKMVLRILYFGYNQFVAPNF